MNSTTSKYTHTRGRGQLEISGVDEVKKAVEGLSTITTPHSIDDNIASTVPTWSILGITEKKRSITPRRWRPRKYEIEENKHVVKLVNLQT